MIPGASMSRAIQVRDLEKTFEYSVKKPNQSWIKNLVSPEKKKIKAVDRISFEVEKGETLAFIGPNGAGKSTTIKMLTGILYPTAGTIRVLGLEPQAQHRELAYKIGTVFGQRSQLVFNLPVRDSFALFGAMYELSASQLRRRQKELVELFELEELLDQPVRKLSLGQRMRAEVAVALIHDPQMVFLDEPTIGLDIIAKRRLREVLTRLNQEFGTTIFLTSHDAGDIEALCERTIVVNHGRIILDASTEKLKRTYFTHKELRVVFKEEPKSIKIPGLSVIKKDGVFWEFHVDTKEYSLNEVLKQILLTHEVSDIDVENTSLEEIIETIYQSPEAV